MKTIHVLWPAIVVSVLALLLVTAAVWSGNPPIKELFPATGPQQHAADLVTAARKDVGEAIVTLEEQLLKVLGLQLGIVAFAATMIFGKDFTPQSPRNLFGILIFLTILLAVVYLHLYKTYLGAYAYAFRLEFGLPEGLRIHRQIFQPLDESHAPTLLRAFISLTETYYIISFLPVYVVVVAAIGFGNKLGIRRSTIWAVSILTVGWAVAFLLPTFRLIIQAGG